VFRQHGDILETSGSLYIDIAIAGAWSRASSLYGIRDNPKYVNIATRLGKGYPHTEAMYTENVRYDAMDIVRLESKGKTPTNWTFGSDRASVKRKSSKLAQNVLVFSSRPITVNDVVRAMHHAD
jgi:hypothetical protein